MKKHNKINLISMSEKLNVLKKLFLKFFIKLVQTIFLQHEQLYSIKLSLKILHLRKQLEYLYLIQHVSHFLSLCPNLHLIL